MEEARWLGVDAFRKPKALEALGDGRAWWRRRRERRVSG
jgi:hypothetical protein